MLYERLVLMKNLLSDDGSIYVHLDHRVVHYVKVIMDEIFGKDHLINEIIWYYKTGGRSRNFFSNKHDTFLLYSKGETFIFNADKVGRPRGEVTGHHMKRNV